MPDEHGSPRFVSSRPPVSEEPTHRPIKRIRNRQAEERCVVDNEFWPCNAVQRPPVSGEPSDERERGEMMQRQVEQGILRRTERDLAHVGSVPPVSGEPDTCPCGKPYDGHEILCAESPR